MKAAVARLGPLYWWARRLRAAGRYAARRPHDPDFAAFGQLDGDGLFLDVGASIGQSALSFRVFNRRSPIFSLEPLPSHRNDLRFAGLVARRHSFLIAGAAAESRRATLYVPTLGSYELPAESSLSRDDAAAVLERLRAEGASPSRLRLKEIEIDLRRLDELGLDPAFVKIDVEGASSRGCTRRSSAAIRS
jgi:FkbM family methyltransferase